MSVIAFRLRRNTLQFSAFGAALMLSLMLGIAIPILSTQSLYRLVMVAVAGRKRADEKGLEWVTFPTSCRRH